MSSFNIAHRPVRTTTLCLLTAALILGFATALANTVGRQYGNHALLLKVDGGIGPATSDYIDQGFQRAESRHANLIILEMDTPGGLSLSMRRIVKDILNAPIPVVVYVAPSGARAASAGTYITYAANIAAMAPATNIGAATPVSMGGGGNDNKGKSSKPAEHGDKNEPVSSSEAERRKVVNDAVAYIRTLAEQRDRNADWAEQAVREGVSLTSQAAVKENVVDLIANNMNDLLAKINGRTVTVKGTPVVLHTKNMAVKTFSPSWRIRFLGILSNPTLAYLLLMAGIIGLVLEGLHPGATLPGVVGAICLLLALFAFQLFPVNYAGLALVALGVVLMIAEALVPSFGALGFGGILAFIFGSILLMNTSVPGFEIPLGLVLGISIGAAATLCGVIYLFWHSRHRPIHTGRQAMVGSVVMAVEPFDTLGWVRVHGERWHARTDSPMRDGQTGRQRAVS